MNKKLLVGLISILTVATPVLAVSYIGTGTQLVNYIKTFSGTDDQLNTNLKYMCDNAVFRSYLYNYFSGINNLGYTTYVKDGWIYSSCRIRYTNTYWNSYYKAYMSSNSYSYIWSLKWDVSKNVIFSGSVWSNLVATLPIPE